MGVASRPAPGVAAILALADLLKAVLLLEDTEEALSSAHLVPSRVNAGIVRSCRRDRKSTRLNSSHANISYAVFCLKKKTTVLPVRTVWQEGDIHNDELLLRNDSVQALIHGALC